MKPDTPVLQSINPATGEALASFPTLSPGAVDTLLERAAKAQLRWAQSPLTDRAALLVRLAGLLRASSEHLASLITAEMGKPLAEARAEIEKSAWVCEFYAENAERFMADEAAASGAAESYVAFDPLGVVLAIMPWNYPFWQFFRFAAPALTAGNGIVLKHASNVPQCADAIAGLFRAADAPDGLLQNFFLAVRQIEGVIADRRIAALTLTGSTEVGRIVAAQGGRFLKKQVLELGGSDPFIVLADADIERAAAAAVKARFQNTGQSCIAAKRFLVENAVADRFVDLFCDGTARLVVGDPTDPRTTIGPMAREPIRAEIGRLVAASVADGAEVRLGGELIDGPGWFFQPTVLDHVTPAMAVFREETFGPVAAIIRIADAEEGVRLANASEFGLGAAIWTSDIGRAKRMARAIQAGAVFVNGIVASDPRLPFGGVKNSGYGRELGLYGLREFTNVKTVWIGPNGSS